MCPKLMVNIRRSTIADVYGMKRMTQVTTTKVKQAIGDTGLRIASPISLDNILETLRAPNVLLQLSLQKMVADQQVEIFASIE